MILKTIAVVFAALSAWVVLTSIWAKVVVKKFVAQLPEPRTSGVVALDPTLLWRSPWYWLAVTAIATSAVLIGWRWLRAS
jgi:hypothetical protein